MKILAVSSGGGHFSELLRIAIPLKKRFQVMIVTEEVEGRNQEVDYYLPYSNRSNKVKYLFAFFRNFLFAYKHLKQIKPDTIISTGAHTAFFYFVIGKIFFKTTNVYIESYAKVKTVSLAYKMSKNFIDQTIVQHQELQGVIPNSKYFGGVY